MRRARLTWLQLLLVLGLALMLQACEEEKKGGGDDEGETDPVALVRQGWSAFEALDYATAETRFQQAIARPGHTVDAYSGAGWTAYSAGDGDYARDRWEAGLDVDDTNYDIRAGMGFLEAEEGNHAAAVTYFSGLLVDNATWSFIHIPGLDYMDLHVALAQSYYLQNQFSDALAEVRMLNAVFSADVDTPEGVAALRVEIERLFDIYRG